MSSCTHWWLVASPQDVPEGDLPATCKLCGAQRTYQRVPAPTTSAWYSTEKKMDRARANANSRRSR